MSELRTLIANLPKNRKPSVITLCETWTNPTIIDGELSIPGYALKARLDRTDTTDGRGGGILTYVKEGILAHEEQSDVLERFNQGTCL